MSMKRVNFRRGLFRVWVILSCLWAIIVCALLFGDVRGEFAKAASLRHVDVDALAAKYGGVPAGQATGFVPPPLASDQRPAKKPADRPLTVVHSEPLPPAPCTKTEFGDLPVSCGPKSGFTPPPLSSDQGPAKPCTPDKFGGIPVDCAPPRQGTYTDADIAAYDAAAAHPWRTYWR